MNNQRGMTVVESFLTIIMLALIVWTGFYAYDAYWASTRYPCYDNQTALNKILFRTATENKREMGEVITAYAVKYPDDHPPVLVVLFTATAQYEDHQLVVVDLSKDNIAPGRVVCPLREGPHVRPIIDYWYAFGRWHCLHNKWHTLNQ
jgi:hypothetical protein